MGGYTSESGKTTKMVMRNSECRIRNENQKITTEVHQKGKSERVSK